MSRGVEKGSIGAKQLYLAVYNTAQLAGWGSAAYLTLHAAVKHGGGDIVYRSAGRIVGALMVVHQ